MPKQFTRRREDKNRPLRNASSVLQPTAEELTPTDFRQSAHNKSKHDFSKITVSSPGDALEVEARGIADKVANQSPAETISKKEAAGLQLQPNSTQTLKDSIGAPLDLATRASMERQFGYDLSKVSIHTDESSALLAQALGAQAFTQGADIAFAKNRYAPDTNEGKHLLAHELTHVVQQTGLDPVASDNTIFRQEVPAAPAGPPLGSQLPPQVDLAQMALSFQLPGGKALTGDWNDLSTTNPTTVSLRVTPTGLQVSFTPGLLIDAQYPFSDMEWSGLTFDFATAAITAIPLTDTQSLAISAQSKARSAISGFFSALIAGSAMAAAGYNPVTDTNLMGTLTKIKSNFESAPSSGGDLKASDMSNVALSANIALKSPITQGTPEGSVVISGGASITVRLAGSGEDVKNGPTVVDEVDITPGSMIVQKNGEDVAKIGDLTIAKGGAVTVNNVTLLGSAKTAAGAESGIRLLALVLALSGGVPEDKAAIADKNPSIDAEIVQGVTKRLIQDALTSAVRELILQNAGAMPGVDLPSIFGVQQKGDFPASKGGSKAA